MDSLLHLLFPTSCLICESSGQNLCHNCDSKIIRNDLPFTVESIKVHSAAFYGDELARVILLAKEKNNLAARNYLAELVVHSFMEATHEIEGSLTILLIPIPSRSVANRKRGFRHSHLLAKSVASLIKRCSSHEVTVRELLKVNRRTADQSGLNRAQRHENLAGAFSFQGSFQSNGGARARELVFLIDDLVTSGISMREGLRALKGAGIAPFGALTAGVSPRVFPNTIGD